MAQSESSKLTDLIWLSVQYELVTACELSKDRLAVAFGTQRLIYGHADGRVFLQALLQGWLQAEKSRRAGSSESETPRARGKLFTPMPVAGRGEARSSGEQFARSLLDFARKMHFIEDFSIDDHLGLVTIHAGSTSTRMTFSETLSYLTDVLHDEAGAAARAMNSTSRAS
jgi:hypothetical protein